MNHDMTAVTAADLHSTFEGHVLPGSMFILWALIWMAQRLRQGSRTTYRSGRRKLT